MASYASYSDHQLTSFLPGGDRVAFTTIYERHHDRIYRLILKYLKSAELSEDICQNVFLKIWEQREQLAEIKEFSAFSFTIAKRQALDFLKRAAVEQNAMGIILKSYPENRNIIEDQQQAKEYMDFIENVLTRLPNQSRRIFKLCRQDSKSYDEVAALLGITRHAVKKHMVKSMKVLREAVEGELGIPLTVLLAILATKI
jgi:RNA polymerase sigma-70 factor (family 1)